MFVVCINEIALKRVFKTVFNSSSRAVMGVSVVLEIKPRGVVMGVSDIKRWVL